MDELPRRRARRAGRHHRHRGRRRRARTPPSWSSRTPTASVSPSSTSCGAGSGGATTSRGATCSARGHARRPRSGCKALERSTDGFELAEVDLELRGEGTILGTRQKGATDLKLASLRRDKSPVAMAREVAFDLVDADPTLADHPDLAEEIRLLVDDEEAFLFKS